MYYSNDNGIYRNNNNNLYIYIYIYIYIIVIVIYFKLYQKITRYDLTIHIQKMNINIRYMYKQSNRIYHYQQVYIYINITSVIRLVSI